jgi:pimeloyl-ACP methyl ester carboxylesterase
LSQGFESYAVGSHAVGSDAAASDRASVPLGSIEDEMAVLVKSMPQLSSPPVLIGHGLGALLAQKYLESYAGIALVLVAPFPPDPRAAIDLLTFDHAFSPSTLEQHAQSVQSEPDPTHLKVDAARPETALNLEPLADFLEGVLVVTTGNDPVISANDVGALMRSHNIHDENEGLASFISAPGSGGHLSMADPAWEAPGGLSDQLAAWIEEKF